VINELSHAMSRLNLQVPDIDLVKMSEAGEFGTAHTRRVAIMIPEAMAAPTESEHRLAYFLLAHELFHVLSRADAQLRDELYALLGFRTVQGFEYPAELEERRVSNPDAFEYMHALTVRSRAGDVDVLPVIQSLLPLGEITQIPNFFDALDVVLLRMLPPANPEGFPVNDVDLLTAIEATLAGDCEP